MVIHTYAARLFELVRDAADESRLLALGQCGRKAAGLAGEGGRGSRREKAAVRDAEQREVGRTLLI